MSRTWKIVIGVVVLLVIGGAVAAATVSFGGRGPEIDTATVESVDLSVTVTASGKVEAGRDADVYPPTQGTLGAVYVKDGDAVKAGDKLAAMDTAALEVAVEQAKAGIAAADAQLEGVDNNAPTNADYVAASASVNAAQSAYTAAKAQLAAVDDGAPTGQAKKAAQASVTAGEKSYQAAVLAAQLAKAAYQTTPTPDYELAYKNAKAAQAQAYASWQSAKASQQALLNTDLTAAEAQAQAAVDQAYSALKSAEAACVKLRNTSVTAQREAAYAAMRQADAGLVLAQQNIDNATLVAPIDGIVFFNSAGGASAAAIGGAGAGGGSTLKPAVGSAVSPQAPPFTVVDLAGSKFVAEVDEADISRVKKNMEAVIRFDAYPGDDVLTTISRVQPAARQTATGGTVFPVDLSLADVGVDLLLGMKGDADIKVESVPTAIVIPIESLFDENGQTYVFVVEDETLAKVDIEVGAQTDTQAQIVSGLTEGQVVALSGAETLTDGMAVRTK